MPGLQLRNSYLEEVGLIMISQLVILLRQGKNLRDCRLNNLGVWLRKFIFFFNHVLLLIYMYFPIIYCLSSHKVVITFLFLFSSMKPWEKGEQESYGNVWESRRWVQWLDVQEKHHGGLSPLIYLNLYLDFSLLTLCLFCLEWQVQNQEAHWRARWEEEGNTKSYLGQS